MPKMLGMEQGRNLNIHPEVNVKKIIRLKVLIQSKGIECFFLQRLYFVQCKLFVPPGFSSSY